jgi:hypothetical protein
MQLSRVGAGFAVAMLVASAAFAQKVTTDYTRGVDFGQYRTFMWIKEPQPSSPLVRQRIIDDVNRALAAKGMTLVTSDADVAVAAHAATQQERTLNTFYNGFGGGWRWGGDFGSATTTTDTYEIGTLVVDLFDAKTKSALWRSTATKTLSGNPEKNAASLNKAITRMFKDYPPASRAGMD